MKKLIVLLAVAAMACVSSIALAADVTVGGNLSIRNRDFSTLGFGFDKNVNTNVVDTQTKYIFDLTAKTGDTMAKISLWNDFDSWGGTSVKEHIEGVASAPTGSGVYDRNLFGAREAWLSFSLPYTGFTIKGGHQLLQLANGLFFRNMHYGTDAWVAYRDDGPNHFAFVDIKSIEGNVAYSDDVDAYVFLDTFKITSDMIVGADLTLVNDRKNTVGFGGAGTTKETQAQNLGVNFAGKMGPLGLKAEFDQQFGKAKGNDAKFKGNVIWVRGDVTMDPAAVNFTVARGSGPKIGEKDYNEFETFQDIDPHYTFLYEYKTVTACGAKNTGFCNTTALNVGGKINATRSLTVGADIWYLMATEKVYKYNSRDVLGHGIAPFEKTNDIGVEFDVAINWAVAPSLSWNWNLGYLMAGDGLGKDDAMGIQGILAYSF